MTRIASYSSRTRTAASLSWAWRVICLFLIAQAAVISPARADGPLAKGAKLPPFAITALGDAAGAAYLGVDPARPFKLADIKADYVILEIIGVYCPICLQHAPKMNGFYGRLARGRLGKKVKMLALAAGATPQELDYLREQKTYACPVAIDTDYSVHKLLGEPKTPFFLVVGKDGVVRYAHLGALEDLNGFMRELEAMAR